MIHDPDTVRYISERRCASGGYCFYRLDEPNAADTFYALASLVLLDALPGDPATLAYLHGFQRDDGSFSTLPAGHCICRSLLLLGERPAHDPAGWLLAAMTPPDAGGRPVESVSLFANLFLCVDLCTRLGIPVPERKKEAIITAVLRYRHPDGGYGHPRPSIIETGHAVFILSALGCPEPSWRSTEFLQKCGDQEFGFLAVPGAKPAYLEHVHAGLLASTLLGCIVSFPEPCRDFIKRCRLDNGGYVRSVFGGTATLENTYLALSARSLLWTMAGPGLKNQSRNDPLRCCD